MQTTAISDKSNQSNSRSKQKLTEAPVTSRHTQKATIT